MNKLFRLIVGIACLSMFMGAVMSCGGITISPPNITGEERILVEKILARRVGYEVAKRYDYIASDLITLGGKTVEVLKGTSTDADINDAMSSFVEELTNEYLMKDPLLQRDVLDLAEILMPTVTVDTNEEFIPLDENLKAELIAILEAFNEGVRIAGQDSK